MDKLIQGILGSKQTNQVKEAFLEKVAGAAVGCDNKETCYSVLETCVVILYPSQKIYDGTKDLFICDRVERLLISWVENNTQLSTDFVNDFVLNTKVEDIPDTWMKCRHIKILQHLLNVLRGVTTNGYESFKFFLKEYLLYGLFNVNEICLLSHYSSLLLQNSEILKANDNKSSLIQLIINIVSKTTSEDLKSMVEIDGSPSHLHYLEAVSELFGCCVDADINIMKYGASLVFKEISDIARKPSIYLSILLAHLKCDILRESLEVSLETIPDISAASILIQLLDWFHASETKTNIDAWIMVMMEYFMRREKHSILIPVTVTKVKQICELIYKPSYVKESLTVLTFMLMSCGNNPSAFHKLLDDLPSLLVHLQNNGSKPAQAAHQTLTELVFTLMYNFPGYTELYTPVINILDQTKKPLESVMKVWLNNFSKDGGNVSVITMEHMKPVETGLRNLGNTCYMNSVIQALFNMLLMKQRIFEGQYENITQTISMNLQKVFAYLHLSKRSCIEPKQFFAVSRPNWFQPGSQQDCSEYLKHLLDKLQQESNKDGNKIDDLFNGEINATVECLHCHSCSHQKEVFNDLPLSFRDTNSKENHGIMTGSSLKGGDSSDILDTKKVHFAIDEPSNVKTPLKSDTSIMEADETPQNADLSIIDLVNNYFLPELLKDSNQYHCNNCANLQDAYKSMKIAKFPKYLILTLKRFTYNVFTKQRSKILDIIRYPPSFSICNGCDSCYEALGTQENTVLTFTSETNCQSSTKYRVSSVIVHSGHTSDSGHYYCYSCRYSGDGHSWYIMNDEEVKSVSDDCISTLASKASRDTPYVCIYERVEHDETVKIDLPGHLIDMVETDNQLYLHEKISKNKSPKSTLVLNNNKYSSRKDDDDDNSQGPLGPCSSGNDWGGGRFVC